MSQHSLIRAGAGLGLLAASCATMAQDLSSFGRPMVFMRLETGKSIYAAFLPWYDAAVVGGPVIFLDLGQSGTQSTWAFGVGHAPSNSATQWAGVSGGWAVANSLSYWDKLINSTATATGTYSFLGGDPQTKTLPNIAYSSVVSNTASCNVTMDAAIESDGYLKWSDIKVQPSKWSTWSTYISSALNNAGSSVVLLITSTSGSVYYLASSGSGAFLGNITGDSSMPTATRFYTSAAAQTSIATSVTASSLSMPTNIPKVWNACLTVYQGRNAQNQSSALLGGKQGYMRIW